MQTTLCRNQNGRQGTLIQAWNAEAQCAGKSDTYAGKRRYPRTEWHAPVLLHVEPEAPRERFLYVTARDISEGGIGLRCREKLVAGTPVRVYVNDQEDHIAGCVRHATGTLGGFLIGIEFTEPQPDGHRLSASA